MWTKEQKIKAVQRMRNDLINDLDFTELDQTETEFLCSDEFLVNVSHKGLDKYLELLESCETHLGSVNRKDYL